MVVVKTIWASVQGDPVFMRRVNGWLAIFWLVMIPISMWQGWLDSVVYVSALSLWALVSGHWSAWQAARVEVRQHEEAQAAQQRDVPNEVVAVVSSSQVRRRSRGSLLRLGGGSALRLWDGRRGWPLRPFLIGGRPGVGTGLSVSCPGPAG